MKVPEVEDCEKLAREVQASFQLPKRARKLHWVENYHQAPPALPCLLWKNFLPLPNSIFACRDIREIQHEKMVAYAWALQFWVEKVDPPAGGRPHLLAESVKELWEEMRCYLSFLDKEVFKGMALLEETSTKPTKEADPQSARTTPVSSGDSQRIHCGEEAPNQIPWLGEGVTSLLTHGGHWADPPSVERSEAEGRKAGSNPSNWKTKGDNHLTGNPLAYARVRSHPASDTTFWFSGSDDVSKEGSVTGRGPWGTPRPVASRSYVGPWGGNYEWKSHHEGWGDRGHLHRHITTSVGRVALSGPEQETLAQGPKIQDITDLIWEVAR